MLDCIWYVFKWECQFISTFIHVSKWAFATDTLPRWLQTLEWFLLKQLRYDFKPMIIQLYQVTVDGEHNVQPDTVLQVQRLLRLV